MGKMSTGEISWQESHRPGQVGAGVWGEEGGHCWEEGKVQRLANKQRLSKEKWIDLDFGSGPSNQRPKMKTVLICVSCGNLLLAKNNFSNT